MSTEKLLDTTLSPPFHLSEKEASVILALVRLARDDYDFFNPVTLDIPYEIIKMVAADVENAFAGILHGGNTQLSNGTLFAVNSILVAVYGEYSRFSNFIPATSGEDIDMLEVKFAELSSH